MLAAATYVETRGGAANPVDAASRGITAGTLGSACVNLLNDLTDCLLTGKLHEAFLAAVKISDYRSRLYVMRLLLDRVPADRLHATKALVAALALSRRDHDAAEKKKNDDVPLPDDADAARSGGSSLDPVLRALVPCVLRGKAESTEESTEGEKENVPDARRRTSTRGKGGGGDGDGALDVFRALVRERRYLLFKGEKTRGPEDRDDLLEASIAFRDARRGHQPRNANALMNFTRRGERAAPAETRRVDSRVDRAYAARYSAMKRQKEGRGVERQKGAKSASVSSDDDAFLSERQTDAVVTREAFFSRGHPAGGPLRGARAHGGGDGGFARARARARARDRQLRLTYVEPVPPRAARVPRRRTSAKTKRETHGSPPGNAAPAHVRAPCTSRGKRARGGSSERARRRARGEAVSSEDDDDVEAREATDTDVFKTVAFDPTNPLRRVSVPKHASEPRPRVPRWGETKRNARRRRLRASSRRGGASSTRRARAASRAQ